MAFTISSRKIKSYGKRSLLLAVLLTVCIGLCGGLTSCGDDDFKSLPREIQQFISQYFPGQGVANYKREFGITQAQTLYPQKGHKIWGDSTGSPDFF